MPIPVGYERYSGDMSYELSNNQWLSVESALGLIFSDPSLSAFLATVTNMQFGREPADPNVVGWRPGIITFGDLTYSGTIVDDVDGGNFQQSFARALFHELVHEKFGSTSPHTYDVFADEERAVFLENALFRPAFGGGERVGHTSGTLSGVSVTAVDYLAGMNLTSATVSGQDSRFTFAAGGDTT